MEDLRGSGPGSQTQVNIHAGIKGRSAEPAAPASTLPQGSRVMWKTKDLAASCLYDQMAVIRDPLPLPPPSQGSRKDADSYLEVVCLLIVEVVVVVCEGSSSDQ